MFGSRFRKCRKRWAVLCCSRPLRMRRRLRKNSGPMRFGRFAAAFFAQWVRVIFGQTSRANGSRFPRISGALSTMKDSHDSKHANRVCISAPFGGIGGIAPDVHPLNRQGPVQKAHCFPQPSQTNGPRRGAFFMLVRSVSCAPDKQGIGIYTSKFKTYHVISN